MTGREKFVIAASLAIIVINVGVAAWLGISTDETNPVYYVGFAIPVVFFGWLIWSIARKTRVRKTGVKGRMKVLTASELMGGVVSVNQQPYLRLEVELDVPGRPPERVSKRMLVPRLAVPGVMSGETFDVTVDPDHAGRFVVDG